MVKLSNQEDAIMKMTQLPETIVDQKVTYNLGMDGKFFIIENVPARVCLETGEQFFAPETVEKLQEMVWSHKKPKRHIQTPVYEFV